MKRLLPVLWVLPLLLLGGCLGNIIPGQTTSYSTATNSSTDYYSCGSNDISCFNRFVNHNKNRLRDGSNTMTEAEYFTTAYKLFSKLDSSRLADKSSNLANINYAIKIAHSYESGRITKEQYDDSYRRGEIEWLRHMQNQEQFNRRGSGSGGIYSLPSPELCKDICKISKNSKWSL